MKIQKQSPTEEKLMKKRDKLAIKLATALNDIGAGKIYPGSHAKKKIKITR